MTAVAMEAEFDDIAGWTADAVAQLGERYAIPAACRGSASPAALAWLAEACELSTGTVLLDVGAGAGGPAAWAAKRFGVRPILVEPMPAACRAAARMFGLPVIMADGRDMPLRSASIDVAWCLGVLDTVRDQAGLLAEIHRVLRPGASLGLLVVVARDPGISPVPEGNHFPTQTALAALLDAAGFDLVEQVERPSDAPLSWSRRAAQVAEVVATRHRADRAYALAAHQSASFTRLFASGQASIQLIHAVRRPDRRTQGPTPHGGEMSTQNGDDDVEFDLEIEIEVELREAVASHAEEVMAQPPEQWLFDPVEEQAYEVELRSLLGAVVELKHGAPEPADQPAHPDPSTDETRLP
ncbi:methyltransferase family protein [Actinocorallia herbida]|uniref:Methyltransferase family protein n=1 Tax=Actinocorallia herbida TaxID=58109 RepID=A0A3N1CVU8_9ACTN|nr:class I SAM-dependent methyltransferase [Actinocorallia herbida]ROO85374.1 methyltransferase family protein [Actinocorallia herbida]